MSGQPQTPQGGKPGPGGHGQSQERSVVAETSGRCKELERKEGFSGKDDRCPEPNREKDSQVMPRHPLRTMLPEALLLRTKL